MINLLMLLFRDKEMENKIAVRQRYNRMLEKQVVKLNAIKMEAKPMKTQYASIYQKNNYWYVKKDSRETLLPLMPSTHPFMVQKWMQENLKNTIITVQQ